MNPVAVWTFPEKDVQAAFLSFSHDGEVSET